MAERTFHLKPPKLQISFAHRLVTLQQTHLQPALLETVGGLDIVELDAEIAKLVPAQGLKLLAAAGLRAEMLFVLPLVLKSRPALLTYYRTLLGYSQKEFYSSGSGLSAFRKAEDGEGLGATAQKGLPAFCEFLNMQAMTLLTGMVGLPLNKDFLRDLSLLSVGPQWRGGRNNELGTAGIDMVFQLILAAISHASPTLNKNKKQVDLVNAAGRQVTIALAADPDIVIIEKLGGQFDLPLVAIEVKAGTDASNIHNRIGEAEKSHLNAKTKKFTEFWTVINVNQVDAAAMRQSPTTNRFFSLSQLLSKGSPEQIQFVSRIIQLTGIPAKAGE